MPTSGKGRREILPGAHKNEAIERDAEAAAQMATLRPRCDCTLRLGERPLAHWYPLTMKERILPAAMVEFISAGRTMEAELRNQFESMKRTLGVKMTAVKDLEPVIVALLASSLRSARGA